MNDDCRNCGHAVGAHGVNNIIGRSACFSREVPDRNCSCPAYASSREAEDRAYYQAWGEVLDSMEDALEDLRKRGRLGAEIARKSLLAKGTELPDLILTAPEAARVQISGRTPCDLCGHPYDDHGESCVISNRHHCQRVGCNCEDFKPWTGAQSGTCAPPPQAPGGNGPVTPPVPKGTPPGYRAAMYYDENVVKSPQGNVVSRHATREEAERAAAQINHDLSAKVEP